MEAGLNGLSLLAVPLNVHVLQALADGEHSLGSLSRAVGHPPATTMRSYLRTLAREGAIERRREAGFPGAVAHSLTESGEKLLAVGEVLQRWLDLAPDGPVPNGSRGAKSAVGALVEGWSLGIVRALASRPFTLTELSRLIPHVSYPTLERRLGSMRRLGLVEARRDSSGRGTPYCVTDWLRHSVAPLTASVEWEHRWSPRQAPPIRRIDIEASLLLAATLLELPEGTSGVCRIAAEMKQEKKDLEYAGVMVTVREGKLVSCASRLDGRADAWATGSAANWLLWFNEGLDRRLELGGDASLATAVIESLRTSLTGAWEAPIGARAN